MPTCRVCGEHTDLPIECNFCGREHCSHHRLPEKHDCQGLDRVEVRGRERNWIPGDDVKSRTVVASTTASDEPATDTVSRDPTATEYRDPLELSGLQFYALFSIMLLSAGWVYAEYLTGATTMEWIVLGVLFLVGWVVIYVVVLGLFGQREDSG